MRQKISHSLRQVRYLSAVVLLMAVAQTGLASAEQSPQSRMISGVIVGPKSEVLSGVTVVVRGGVNEPRTMTDERGQFSIISPAQEVTLHVEGQYIKPQDRIVSAGEASANLQIEIEYLIPPIPRIYVDSAPHTVANGALTVSGWRNAYASLRYRHIGNYRLDGEDATIRAAGLDVLDLAITKPVRPWVDLNFNIDNLTNKVYYETQNYFESRIFPDSPSLERIHGTPGYPFGLTVGLTFRLGEKNR